MLIFLSYSFRNEIFGNCMGSTMAIKFPSYDIKFWNLKLTNESFGLVVRSNALPKVIIICCYAVHPSVSKREFTLNLLDNIFSTLLVQNDLRTPFHIWSTPPPLIKLYIDYRLHSYHHLHLSQIHKHTNICIKYVLTKYS